jgi:hypothetical protein
MLHRGYLNWRQAVQHVPARLGRCGKQVRAALALLPLVPRLLSNSLVRDYLHEWVARRIAEKLGREHEQSK